MLKDEISLADIRTHAMTTMFPSDRSVYLSIGAIAGPIIGALFGKLVDWGWTV